MDDSEILNLIRFGSIFWKNLSFELWAIFTVYMCLQCFCLQCFDAVGWAAGRALGIGSLASSAKSLIQLDSRPACSVSRQVADTACWTIQLENKFWRTGKWPNTYILLQQPFYWSLDFVNKARLVSKLVVCKLPAGPHSRSANFGLQNTSWTVRKSASPQTTSRRV